MKFQYLGNGKEMTGDISKIVVVHQILEIYMAQIDQFGHLITHFYRSQCNQKPKIKALFFTPEK